MVLIPWSSWQLDPKSGGNVTNIVWAEAQGDAGAVGRFPVKYKKAINTNEITEKLLPTTNWSPKTIQTLIKRLVTKGALTYDCLLYTSNSNILI